MYDASYDDIRVVDCSELFATAYAVRAVYMLKVVAAAGNRRLLKVFWCEQGHFMLV